jgi:predicted DNA-binding transcriptional regulator YafY
MVNGVARTRLVGPGNIAGYVQLHQALPLIERQHALIEELRLRSPRFMAGRELAARTGTTVRTVERDIVRLVDAGIPVQVRRGPGGGYRIDARRSLPPVTLTPGEASALVASLVGVGPYISASAQSVLAKLIAALVLPAGTEPRHAAALTAAARRSIPPGQPDR